MHALHINYSNSHDYFYYFCMKENYCELPGLPYYRHPQWISSHIITRMRMRINVGGA